eukprot:5888919-Prymnesium_polylepis.2
MHRYARLPSSESIRSTRSRASLMAAAMRDCVCDRFASIMRTSERSFSSAARPAGDQPARGVPELEVARS